MKIISFYLPQFHSIPENDEWWGKGFTEWVNVKKARPLFEGHEQPKVPLAQNYYNLLDKDVMRWQAKIAKDYGIYGFCFYHYWFDGHLLLEKPLENYLSDQTIDFPYCICWANENWTNLWVSDKRKVLIAQTYGGVDEWKKHYNYLKKFFKDKRYIRINNKPLLVIYKPDLIPRIREMLELYTNLAMQDGFEGICFACQRPDSLLDGNNSDLSSFDYCIEYQPIFAFSSVYNRSNLLWLRKLKRRILLNIEKYLHITATNFKLSRIKDNLTIYSYDELWNSIIQSDPMTDKSIPGAFVNWDNTPRRGARGSVVDGATPLKFKKYLKQQIIHAKKDYKQDMMFVFAWNEWGEGGYLEPDERYGYGYLNAVYEALKETDELPFVRGNDELKD